MASPQLTSFFGWVNALLDWRSTMLAGSHIIHPFWQLLSSCCGIYSHNLQIYVANLCFLNSHYLYMEVPEIGKPPGHPFKWYFSLQTLGVSPFTEPPPIFTEKFKKKNKHRTLVQRTDLWLGSHTLS